MTPLIGRVEMKREHAQKQKSRKSEKATDSQTQTTDTKQALKNDLDDILDEIDGVLETNAQEFIEQYIQKGGE